MGSKSSSVTEDKTSNVNKTEVTDRRAIQQRGQQILDSVIIDNDDKVMMRAMQELRVGFLDASERNSATVDTFQKLAEKLMGLADKGQVQISEFGYKALDNARDQLDAMEKQGEFVIRLADETTKGALSLADNVSAYQAQAQRDALEILSDAKTGDYSDSLKTLSGMVMLFSLVALYIAKKG